MRKSYIIHFAVLIACLALTETAFADVKIKARQTMQGQSYENTTYIKGKRQRTEQNMGGMESISLMQCDLKRSVRIMPAAQTYMVDAWDLTNSVNQASQTSGAKTPTEKGGVVTMTYTTKDTGERKQMFGYTARHLIITMEMESSPDACSKTKSKMQYDGWYIDAEFALDCESQRYAGYSPNSNNGGCRDRYETKQIGTAKRGYPVYEKMTMFDESGKETMSMLTEVVELSKATLDAALFDVPAGYREVKDSTELYASMSGNTQPTSAKTSSKVAVLSGNNPVAGNVTSGISTGNAEKPVDNSAPQIGPKQAGVVRVGLVGVKTGTVGEGINGAELALAIQNTLGEYMKSPTVQLVSIDAKLPVAIDAEAKEKECDFVVIATAAHKKGGGGFGKMFGKVAPSLGSIVPMAGMGGSVAGAVAGQVATQVIWTAASMASNVKAKDELTLDVKAQPIGGAPVLAKQFKTKAKSDGEDIISPLVEQVATAITEAVSRK